MNETNTFSKLIHTKNWSQRLIYLAYAVAGGWFAFNIVFTTSKLVSYRFLETKIFVPLLLVGILAVIIFGFFAYGFVRLRHWVVSILQIYIALVILNLILVFVLAANVDVAKTIIHSLAYVIMLLFTLSTSDFLHGNKNNTRVIVSFLATGLMFTVLTLFLNITNL